MNRRDIDKINLEVAGIAPAWFDCSSLESVIANRGAALTVAHRHDYYVVIWLTEGKGKHFIEFVAHDIAPNTLILLGRNQIHFFENLSNVKGQGIGICFFDLSENTSSAG